MSGISLTTSFERVLTQVLYYNLQSCLLGGLDQHLGYIYPSLLELNNEVNGGQMVGARFLTVAVRGKQGNACFFLTINSFYIFQGLERRSTEYVAQKP